MPSHQDLNGPSLGLNLSSQLGFRANPPGLLKGCCSLTPLRFFRACICEGLGVVSGLAIWLQRKRKASFSELRDRLSGLGCPRRPSWKQVGTWICGGWSRAPRRL